MNLRLHYDETIVAIIPQYTPQGDQVNIITTCGRTIISSRRLRTILRKVAKHHAADLCAVKRLAAPAVRRPLLAPLPLSPRLFLFPVKVRQPRVEGDPCCAYVNACLTKDICDHAVFPYQSILHLQGDHQLPALWSGRTVRRKLEQSLVAQRTSPLATASVRETPSPYHQEALGEVIDRLIRLLPLLEAKLGGS